MIDVYCYPEKFGLEIVGTIEENLSYEFNMFVVWVELDGSKVYCANDSGCSCPSPFEDFTEKSSLTEVGSLDQLEREIATWNGVAPYKICGQDEVQSLLEKVKTYFDKGVTK